MYHHFLAECTLEQYNSYLTKYKDFCVNSYGEVPPQVALREASVTGFSFSICQKSKRPLSIVKMAWAAITHLYDSLEFDVRSGDMSHFMQALVKRFTSCPQGRTPIPPIQPILNVFRKWGCNEKLPIEKLRQKCIALLCLTAMCRPSDIAPKIGFLRKQIQFNSDKSATNRKGFEIQLTPATEKFVDPVESLLCYLQHTNDLNKECGNDPVFRSRTSPSEEIGPSTVTKILRETLQAAGLAEEYTAWCFRAAGTTAAIRSGCDPDSTRQIVRWISRDVFYDHYVYPVAPSITNKIMSQA